MIKGFLKNHSLSPSRGRAMDLIRDKLERATINDDSNQCESYVIRPGSVALGKNASKSLLNEIVTPGVMGKKRHLKFSPDTSRGSYDKVSIMDTPSPVSDASELMIGGKLMLKRILRGRRLFQHTPKQMKTSPGVGERKKKKTSVVMTRRIRTKLSARRDTLPVGQPLITCAMDKVKKRVGLTELQKVLTFRVAKLPDIER